MLDRWSLRVENIYVLNFNFRPKLHLISNVRCSAQINVHTTYISAFLYKNARFMSFFLALHLYLHLANALICTILCKNNKSDKQARYQFKYYVTKVFKILIMFYICIMIFQKIIVINIILNYFGQEYITTNQSLFLYTI